MRKKLISLTLAVIMIFSCMSVVVSADSVITEIEPNDEPLTAQVIPSNASVSGVIAAPDLESANPHIDLDAYKFTLTERSKINLTLTSSTGLLIPLLGRAEDSEPYTPELDADDLESLPEEMVINAIVPEGVYYIILIDLSFTEQENPYSFTLTSESAVETLKKEDGVWKYYVGKNFAPETTLVKYEGVWFYVEDGIWNKTANTLTKYNDVWFYIKNGKWTSAPTTLVKYEGKWFYIKNGKWDRNAETLVKYKGKWFYIKNGKWNKATTIFEFSGKKFYVKGGIAQLDFSGKKKISGQTYLIKNGKVVAFGDKIISEIELNDYTYESQTIKPHASVKGSLSVYETGTGWIRSDEDYYKFILSKKSKVTLTITARPNKVNVTPYIESEKGDLYSPELSEEELENPPETMVISTVLPAGTHYVYICYDYFGDSLHSEQVPYTFDITYEPAVETLKLEDGVWKYYVDGKFSPQTTLVKYNGVWFYVEDGIWNKDTTTLAKHRDTWFYIKNGKWSSKPTTLINSGAQWLYIKNGKWSKTTTIVKYSGKKFYVKDGIAQLDFSGKKKINGKTYTIKNGKVV